MNQSNRIKSHIVQKKERFQGACGINLAITAQTRESAKNQIKQNLKEYEWREYQDFTHLGEILSSWNEEKRARFPWLAFSGFFVACFFAVNSR